MRIDRLRFLLRREAAIIVACGAVTLSQRVVAATQLPIPCVAGACGATVNTFVTPPPGAKTPPKITAVQSGNTLTVNQGTTNNAILNWSSFNVGADGKVTFIQPTATSVALNRIFQGSPSTIFGQVTANGQIYLINPNGIVFGSTAQVNTAGLIAASLGISDAVFNAGILSPQVLSGTFGSKAALSGDVPLAPGGNPAVNADNSTVSVDVEKGATISTQGGRILLAAPVVQNNGTLSAPDGQVVLAAGTNVYLLASQDPSLRGLIVEVDGTGTASNQVSGLINTPRWAAAVAARLSR
jgi:filamentous hemagglutinin family protein